MLSKKAKNEAQTSLFFGLGDTLNPQHELYKLANKINWEVFEDSFKSKYSEKWSRPAKPIRLMCGLLILKHLRNLSDESVVLQWTENAYYQYFCGENEFQTTPPCTPSELVHFRKRIGEAGMEVILKESIRVNDDHTDEDNHKMAFIDSTVQEKNVTYPTDAKLHKKIIKKCWNIIRDKGLKIRQSYTRTLKDLCRDQRFRNHPKNRQKALRADRKMRTIAGRLVRELQRLLPTNNEYLEFFGLADKVLSQKKGTKKKVYSLHEPEVQCISKGKEHKKYEFGNKVSIIRSVTGIIIGAKSFRNEYDGHTISDALAQVKRISGKDVEKLAGDRGYRGQKIVGNTEILIPGVPQKKDSRYQKKKKHDLFCKRAGIEPTIGHLKSDYRLGRNFYKGLQGDAINVILAAAAYNFKRAMKVLLLLLKSILGTAEMCFEIRFPENKLAF